MRKNVFHSRFKIMQPKVSIIGSGANGVGNYDRLPDDSFKIALNSAIAIPGIRYDAWMVVDIDCMVEDWFKKYDTDTRLIRIYNADLPVAKIKSHNATNADDYCTYTFIPNRPILKQSYDVREGMIRGGVTVAGCAIQLAYLFADNRDKLEICLCGIDMESNKYYDDTTNPVHDAGKVWEHKQPLENMIHWMIINGVDIYSVSETALSIEER